MATTLRVLPSKAAPTESEAKTFDQKIRRAVGEYHRSFAHLAFYGWRLKLANGFSEVGFADEYAYMTSLGVGKTRWFQAVAVGQALSSLPVEELEKIPTDQALLLLSVKPELKTQHPWVKEAQTDTYMELARKVEERNRLLPGPERVPMTPMSFRVAATAKSAIFTNLLAFQEKHGLSSVGQALEFIVADRATDTSILGELFEAIKLLNGVMASLSPRKELEEERKWLSLANGRLNSVYRTLLESSREGSDAVHEKEVHQTKDPASDTDDQGWEDPLPEQYGGQSGETAVEG